MGHGDSDSDWKNAELRLARDTFRRRIATDEITSQSVRDVARVLNRVRVQP